MNGRCESMAKQVGTGYYGVPAKERVMGETEMTNGFGSG